MIENRVDKREHILSKCATKADSAQKITTCFTLSARDTIDYYTILWYRLCIDSMHTNRRFCLFYAEIVPKEKKIINKNSFLNQILKNIVNTLIDDFLLIQMNV